MIGKKESYCKAILLTHILLMHLAQVTGAPDIPKALLECDDGACISYTDWCDYKNDCHDGSDEKYCAYKWLQYRRVNESQDLGYPGKKICKEVNCCFSSPLFINTDPVVRRCSIYNYIEMCVNITCPAVCKCDSEKIDCSLHELINVPKVDLSIWKIYLLKDNLIKELKPENLKAFFGLRTFDAGSNKIQRIAPDSFNNLTQLSTLSLERNTIEELDPSLFRYLKQLNLLHLGYNRISKLADYQFANLTQLHFLFLLSNRLKSVEPLHFKGLSSLLTLDLQDNQIQYLPDNLFEDLHQLNFLHLDANRIGEIGEGFLNGLSGLLNL